MSESPKRVVRRTDDQVVAGVCSGVAHHLGVDPLLVRIIWGIALFAGFGLLAYVAAWVLMPDQRDVPREQWAPPRSTDITVDLEGLDQSKIVLLVVAGALLVMGGGLFGGIWWGGDGDGGVLVPVALIGAGVWLLLRDRSPGEGRSVPGAGSAAPTGGETVTGDPATGEVATDEGAGGPVAGGAAGGAGGETTGGEARAVGEERDPLLVEADRIRGDLDAHDPVVLPWDAVAPPEPPAPVRDSGALGRVVAGVLVIGVGSVWAVAAASDWSPDVHSMLAVALAVLGVGLIVSARFGRARWLIGPGVLLSVVLTLIGAVDVPFEGGMGERTHTPTSVEDIDGNAPYRLIFGEMGVDLTGVEFRDSTTVEASLVAGELTVTVPEDVSLEIDARVSAGEITYEPLEGPTRDEEGLDVELLHGVTSGEEAELALDLELGAGEIIVVEEAP